MEKTKIKIGTRGSKLALWQAEHVRSLLMDKNPELNIELIPIKTSGDILSNQNPPNVPMENKNVFIKEVEEALLAKKIDIAVHSLKDMSSNFNDSLKLSSFISGADRCDVLISTKGISILDLPKNSRVGTGSERRSSQLKLLRNDIEILPIRGNVDTRLAKLEEGEYDAIVLAKAGIERLGLQDKISSEFSIDQMVPAAGQGIIAVQTRSEDRSACDTVKKINNEVAESAAKIEFEFMRMTGADCNVPLGVFACFNNDLVNVALFLASKNGQEHIKIKRLYNVSDIKKIPSKLLNELKTLWKDKTNKELDLNEN